jgi:hypothetical protein
LGKGLGGGIGGATSSIGELGGGVRIGVGVGIGIGMGLEIGGGISLGIGVGLGSSGEVDEIIGEIGGVEVVVGGAEVRGNCDIVVVGGSTMLTCLALLGGLVREDLRTRAWLTFLLVLGLRDVEGASSEVGGVTSFARFFAALVWAVMSMPLSIEIMAMVASMVSTASS